MTNNMSVWQRCIHFLRLFKKKNPIQIGDSNQTSNQTEFDDRYLISFRSVANQNGTQAWMYNDNNDGDSDNSPTSVVPKNIDTRIAVTPKDVFNELERVPTMFSLVGLDDKIQILKDKASLITQHYAKREVETLLLCLENRKKYDMLDKNKVSFRDFFSRFDITTDEKINNLLKKYLLVMKSADIFIPEFPDEAVKIMKEYSEKVEELCNKKVKFMVIATVDNFKDVEKKRDPILLAQSPFGFYYYILGAWDKEMICLAEL